MLVRTKKWGLIFFVAAATLSLVEAAPWQKMERCSIVEDAFMNGDSFHVTHERKEYIFRLYFVDAPETDTRFPERLAEQAAYFGCNSNEIRKVGKAAKNFTAASLRGDSYQLSKLK